MVSINSAIETYRYWNLQAEVRAEQERRVDTAASRSKLERLHPDAAGLLREVQSTGVAVVENYWPADKCAAGRAEIDRLTEQYPQVVQHNSGGSDKRMFGVEAVSPLLAEFHDDPMLHAMGEALGGYALYNFATLGARIDAMPQNNGSGDGWHRDAHDFQFKSILYLSDVSLENGPFEYLAGSQKKWRAAFDSAVAGLPSPPNTRYEPAAIDALMARVPLKVQRCSGKAGTLLLVNTSGIHRGRPLKSGSRYALTNYFYHPYQIDRARVTNFPTLMPGAAERIITDLQL